MNNAFHYDPTQPVLTTADMRLTRLLQQDPLRCASVNEYAGQTGIDVGTVLDLLGPALDASEIHLEPVGGEIFVHTAPAGRPVAHGQRQVPPNLWETLREGRSQDEAFSLWRLVRDLEVGGWSVEPAARRLPVVGGRVPLLGLRFGPGIVPLLVFPDLSQVANQAGPLTVYERSGVGICAITCRARELDRAATAVRRWMLEHHTRARCDVLLLEAPRYQPVLLTADDGGITPRSVTIDTSGGTG
jgi:DNA-binding transcriptional LysR family regulator